MSILGIAAIVLSLQIPQRAFDHSWGHLMRAQHYAGAWELEVQGKRLTGEWIMVDRDAKHAPRWWGAELVHLVSASGVYCAIFPATGQMHCETTEGRTEPANLRVSSAKVDEMMVGVGVEAMGYHAGSYTWTTAGRLTAKVKPVRPTVAQGLWAYERIYKRTVAEAIRGTLSHEQGRVVVRMPYEARNYLGSVTEPKPLLSTEVVRLEATIELTTAPTAKITAREIGRYIEDCEDSPHARSSCMPQPRRCTVRQPGQSIAEGVAIGGF